MDTGLRRYDEECELFGAFSGSWRNSFFLYVLFYLGCSAISHSVDFCQKRLLARIWQTFMKKAIALCVRFRLFKLIHSRRLNSGGKRNHTATTSAPNTV